MISNADPTPRLFKASCAALIACTVLVLTIRSVNVSLWADELLTVHLLQADSLSKLWQGIVLGIDGNPPLYLSVGWLLTHLLPPSLPAVAVLKLINVALVGVGVVALWHLCRRIVSTAACWAGTLILVTLNENLLFAAFELRTYATYFATAAIAVLLQQRLIEHGRWRDVLGLALAFVALTLAHTFGIAYVGCIALAGWLSCPRRLPVLRGIALAVAPSIAAMLAWSPFLREQLKVASPYGWITRPGGSELAETLFSSQQMLSVCLAAALCLAVAGVVRRRRVLRWLGELVADEGRQPILYVSLVASCFTAFALAGWLVSLIGFPIFVPRFFTPQLVISFVLTAALAQWLLGLAKHRRAIVLAAAVVLGALMLLNVVEHVRAPFHSEPVCGDERGTFFETPFVNGELPVVADSPHIFLPRAAYAVRAEDYRFPLDWEVVVNYPTRSRGNAVDYHILQALQTWLPLPQVTTTDDMLRDHQQFLVIETPTRAWFEHLRATRAVEAEKLAQSVPHGPDDTTCTLWKVSSVGARR